MTYAEIIAAIKEKREQIEHLRAEIDWLEGDLSDDDDDSEYDATVDIEADNE